MIKGRGFKSDKIRYGVFVYLYQPEKEPYLCKQH